MKYFWAHALPCVFFALLALPAAAQFAVLKEEATPLYEKPSAQSKLVAVLAAGDTVRILKKQNGWAQLRFHKKQKGWMQLRRPTADSLSAFVRAGENSQNPAANRFAAAEREAAFSAPPKRPPLDGGLSLNLGVFGGDFSYVGRFFYRSLKTAYLEGTFQYVAGQIASQYLMHANARFVRPLGRRFNGYATAGVGVINTVPIQSAGGKSVSTMAFNYGFGAARLLKNNNWLRADLRQFSALRQQGVVNFVEFTVGLDIGIRWSKL